MGSFVYKDITYSGKEIKLDCINCIYNDKSWDENSCDKCTGAHCAFEKKEKE